MTLYTGFGMAVGHKYVEENFEEGAKERVSLLVNNLIAAFKELVGESIWMDEETQVWKKKLKTSFFWYTCKCGPLCHSIFLPFGYGR